MRARTTRTTDRAIRRPTPLRIGGDAGQTTVLATVLVGLVVALLIGVTHLGVAAADRARAWTAADAAALAGVIEEPRGAGAGRRSATEIAARNGAQLTAYEADGPFVEVTVQVGDAQATSRAERVIAPDP